MLGHPHTQDAVSLPYLFPPEKKTLLVIKTAQSLIKALYHNIYSLNIVWKEEHEKMGLYV